VGLEHIGFSGRYGGGSLIPIDIQGESISKIYSVERGEGNELGKL
jgi:hypothetical protein